MTLEEKNTWLYDALEALCLDLTKGYNVRPKNKVRADLVDDALSALLSTKPAGRA